MNKPLESNSRLPRSEHRRELIIVNGTVQGIGFRPAIYGLATRLGLQGSVYNDSRGVVIEVEGENTSIDQFVEGIYNLGLNKMKIDSLERSPLPPLSGGQIQPTYPPYPGGTNRGERPLEKGDARKLLSSKGGDKFVILATRAEASASTMMPPDLAVCDHCRKDLKNKKDKRHQGYFLTACTQCGPRFTVMNKLPYQRQDTAMRAYPLCPECQEEYESPLSRRFNFETNTCSVCGPRLRLISSHGKEIENPIDSAQKLLVEGKILAIKGVGGYHIAVDAREQDAVRRLRDRKRRPDKPFAVMFPDVQTLRDYADVSLEEEKALTSLESPIVLVRQKIQPPFPPYQGGNALERRGGDISTTSPSSSVLGQSSYDVTPPDKGDRGGLPVIPLAEGIAPGQSTIGAMLPYSPLHILLVDRPLVMTSANLTGQPMFFRDDEVREHLSSVVDFILYHDREILIQVDDSVGRVAPAVKKAAGEFQLLRRSRGYVPEAIELPRPLGQKVLSFGAQQKNTFCLGWERKAVLSQHQGDLGTLEAEEAFDRSLRHLMRIYSFQPQLAVCDLHPDYTSTRFARRLSEATGVPLVEVQHHEAHVMSLMLEKNLLSDPNDRYLGVVFDGTGYGRDQTIWGGEFFLTGSTAIERVGHLERVQMPGGEYAVREPYRMMLSYLWNTYGDRRIDDQFQGGVSNQVFQGVWEMVKTGRSGVVTSSMGRLFDAVSALITGRHVVSYEGQAAMELETLALSGNPRARSLPVAMVEESGKLQFTTSELFEALLSRLGSGSRIEDVALGFHKGVAEAVAQAARWAREKYEVKGVLLTGGVFQNRLLCALIESRLESMKIPVHQHSLVPMNDGGISFGQLGYVMTYGLDLRT